MLPSSYRRLRSVSALPFLLAAGFAATAPAHAAGTLAGTLIDNVAQASYDGPDGPVTIDSNIVSFKVDELLDVAVISRDPGDVVTNPGATAQLLTYRVTNNGNGTEAFKLIANPTLGNDQFDPELEQIILDTNNNGVYDPGVDTLYTPGSNDPLLAPDEGVTVFILSTIPVSASDTDKGRVALRATAVTGSGDPGRVFAGQGDGGGDAIVGTTRATQSALGTFVIQAASVSLVKSATILDPFGGSEAVPGATITYQLVASVIGNGSIANLRIDDTIPANTSYVAQSTTLDGNPLTDTADSDAGSFSGTAISVALGTVTGPATPTVTFKVIIN